MNATKRWWQSVPCTRASRSEWPVAVRWHCSWHCDCAGCSRSETTSDGCISIRRDQVQQVGWSIAYNFTSTGGPSCTVCTRCAAWQAANDGRAAERMHDHVVCLCNRQRWSQIGCIQHSRSATNNVIGRRPVIRYGWPPRMEQTATTASSRSFCCCF